MITPLQAQSPGLGTSQEDDARDLSLKLRATCLFADAEVAEIVQAILRNRADSQLDIIEWD